MQYPYQEYKVVLTGASRSGKSCLFSRYFQDIYVDQYEITPSVGYRSKFMSINNKSIKMQVLDIPGEESYKEIRRSTYKGCQVMVFVFDITNLQSFQFIVNQIKNVLKNDLCPYDCSAIVVGTHLDLKDQRKIKFQQASTLGNIIGNYVQVSSKTGQNVEQLFSLAVNLRMKFDCQDPTAKSIYQNLQQNIHNPSLSQYKAILLNQKETLKQSQKPQIAAPSDIEKQKKQSQIPKVIKIVVIGQTNVGKSVMMMKYCQNIFIQSHFPTIGLDFRIKTIQNQGQQYKLQIWDTAGMVRFQPIIQCYYKNLKAALIVYDVTNIDSFNNCQEYIKKIKLYNKENPHYVCIVGNKTDLPRVVDTEIAMKLAQQYQVDFVQISSKNYHELESLFMKITKAVIQMKL